MDGFVRSAARGACAVFVVGSVGWMAWPLDSPMETQVVDESGEVLTVAEVRLGDDTLPGQPVAHASGPSLELTDAHGESSASTSSSPSSSTGQVGPIGSEPGGGETSSSGLRRLPSVPSVSAEPAATADVSTTPTPDSGASQSTSATTIAESGLVSSGVGAAIADAPSMDTAGRQSGAAAASSAVSALAGGVPAMASLSPGYGVPSGPAAVENPYLTSHAVAPAPGAAASVAATSLGQPGNSATSSVAGSAGSPSTLVATLKAEQESRELERQEQSLLDSVPLAPVQLSDDVQRRVQNELEIGFGLAERGAFFSAQQRFMQALSWIVQAHDAQAATSDSAGRNSGGYARALQRAFQTLDEARDLVGLEALDGDSLAHAIHFHRTQLAGVDPREMTAMELATRYCDQAEQQLATALGPNSVASKALFGLAKIQPMLKTPGPEDGTVSDMRAQVLYQAALRVDENNYLAANELGVLISKQGRPEEALPILQHAAKLGGTQPQVWHNLAAVHRMLGQSTAAERAEYEMRLAQDQSGIRPGAALPNMVWVTPEQFAQTHRPDEVPPVGAPAVPVAQPTATPPLGMAGVPAVGAANGPGMAPMAAGQQAPPAAQPSGSWRSAWRALRGGNANSAPVQSWR